MPDRQIQLLTAAIIGLFLISGSATAAQRWYHVELMVFSNNNASTTEQWDATPPLAYPERFRFLLDSSQLNTAGTRPTPFVKLPRRGSAFYNKAAYMDRVGGYRILFHENWVQPVREEANALPLVLDRSGDTGKWPLLQGSVKLYLSRYLHLETNLWLNTRGDYLPGTWQMPAPPLGPASIVIEEPEPIGPQPQESMPQSGAAMDGTDPGSENLVAGFEQETAKPVYPYRHAILLKQHRRMRSKEVHYIDHPILGLVIKISPLTEEDLETMALQEKM